MVAGIAMNKHRSDNQGKPARAEPEAALPALPEWRLRARGGLYEFPVHHMRGGTSTGLVLWERLVPPELALREELLRHLMGVPLQGEHPEHRQVSGLGRGTPTSNKVFFVDTEQADGRLRLVGTLAQLAAQTAAVDWRVNCGNMSAAIPLWALDAGLGLAQPDEAWSIDIRNVNTGVVTTAKMRFDAHGAPEATTIPGVDGAFPGVDLFLHAPAGAKTGKLLPTGKASEQVGAHTVTCIDVAVPMVILDAAEFGKTAHEPIAALEADGDFMQALREVWIEAGWRMGLAHRDGRRMSRGELAKSETVPKVCIVGAPAHGGQLAVRYFTPQAAHPSLAVSGACCIATAALVPGTVAHRLARQLPPAHQAFAADQIAIENPAGALLATVVSRQRAGEVEVRSVAYRRSAQILLRGHVPLYRPSPALRRWLQAEAGAAG